MTINVTNPQQQQKINNKKSTTFYYLSHLSHKQSCSSFHFNQYSFCHQMPGERNRKAHGQGF
jgi:hypothetical protein